MNSYIQVTLAAAFLIAVLEGVAVGAGSAAQAAPLPPCDMRLRLELSPGVPNPRDAGAFSSLLGDHPAYRLTLQWQDAEDASLLTLNLTGPGPEAVCREVADSMRSDPRVVSIEVQQNAVTTTPVSTAQAPGIVRAGADGNWVLEPLYGVSYAQRARDRYECDIWATDQTGFDPGKDDGGLPPDQVTGKRADYLRAEAACFQARGYIVR